MSKTNNARRAADFGEYQRDGRKPGRDFSPDAQVDSITPATGEPKPRYSAEQLERARRKVIDAWAWRKINPWAWNHISVTAIMRAGKGQRVGVQGLVEEVRKKDFVDVDGVPTVTNNSFEPVFARWLIAEHPALAPFVEVRASPLDAVMGGADHDC